MTKDELAGLIRSFGYTTHRQSGEIAEAICAKWGQPAGEPVAWCQPDDANAAEAFSWPGTDKRPHHTTPLYTAQPADSAEMERMRDRIARIGLDIDRALRGEVNTQSPVGTLRLQAIADLSKGSVLEDAVLDADEVDRIVLEHIGKISSLGEGNPVAKLNYYRDLVRAGFDAARKQGGE